MLADTFQLAQIFAIDLVHGVGNERMLVESDLDSTPPKIYPRLLWPNDCLKED
jgi:hypothetical protein